MTRHRSETLETAADSTRLIFGLHFHQPYGNLDEVFADATERCYLPTLALLGEHPKVKTAIHVSGPLLDWAEAHRPDMLDALAALVKRGQVEILGGGDQEPMLAILPDRDAIGQLTRMADRCEELLGARPRGMWLAERVWEPDLARVIAQAGYRFTLLDDSHLRAAGATDPLGAYYVTDKAGHSVAVFPIDYGLRTRIPFAETDDLMEYLRSQRGRVPCYGDDAEKFGLWPTTERRVWQDKWLEQFFLRADAADWLDFTLPSQILADTPSSGAIYIPTISYMEMGAWTLPPEGANRYAETVERMQLAGFSDEAAAFMRGGIWQAFLAKYPESNLIYRKMLRVSRAVAAAKERGDAAAEAAERLLYRGQCNCAYWHGLFGGLYLQHLRAALMAALIEAETLVAPRKEVVLERSDHDGDLADEVILEGPAMNLYLSPKRGGSAIELDLRQAKHHLTGVLARRREAYHVDVARARVVSDEELGNISAHDLVRATEEGLADKLVVDGHPRGAFVDHLLAADVTPQAFDRDYASVVDLPHQAYAITGLGDAHVELCCSVDGLRLVKRIAMDAKGVEARYEITSATPRQVTFACELDFTLLSPDAVGGRRVVVDDGPALAPGEAGEDSNVRAVQVACDDMGVDVVLESDRAAELWRIPIETVSQSERGFERAYQGTALVLAWRVELTKAPLRLSVALRSR